MLPALTSYSPSHSLTLSCKGRMHFIRSKTGPQKEPRVKCHTVAYTRTRGLGWIYFQLRSKDLCRQREPRHLLPRPRVLRALAGGTPLSPRSPVPPGAQPQVPVPPGAGRSPAGGGAGRATGPPAGGARGGGGRRRSPKPGPSPQPGSAAPAAPASPGPGSLSRVPAGAAAPWPPPRTAFTGKTSPRPSGKCGTATGTCSRWGPAPTELSGERGEQGQPREGTAGAGGTPR